MSASLKTIELEISLAIRKAIETKTLDSSSAMTLIHKGMELLSNYQILKGSEKKQILLSVLEQVSAGSDGILGTADDLLPETTLKAIKAIMEGNLVGDIVDTFVAITKGAPVDTQKLLNIGTRVKVLFSACFACVTKSTPVKTSNSNHNHNHKDAIPIPFMKPGSVPLRTNCYNELWVPAPSNLQPAQMVLSPSTTSKEEEKKET